jgi:DNA polymerase III subunit delta'
MIVGHQKIINFLDRSIEKKATAQAYIFLGPEHLGKFSIALDFAQKLVRSDLEINPDLTIIRPDISEKKGIVKEMDIKIEKIRELKHNLSITSSRKYKVAIIDSADRMNKSAQNSLLKTLEEPAENVVAILIASDLGKLLPTIRSRCIVKRFCLVSESEIRNMLPDGLKNKEEIIFWSLGRPGLAMALMENKEELAKRQEAEKELSGLASSNVSDKIAMAEKMSKDAGALREKLNWWLVCLRENIVGKKKFFAYPPNKLMLLAEKIEKSIGIIQETNSNARLVLENLFFEF